MPFSTDPHCLIRSIQNPIISSPDKVESLDDYVTEESPVRVIDVFVDELDLSMLGFKSEPADTGRPGYHPSMMLKLFIYGYMNRVHLLRSMAASSRH
jgi:transposase